jgi:hypothetical protein
MTSTFSVTKIDEIEEKTYGVITHSLEPLAGAVEEVVEVHLVLDIIVLATEIGQTVSLMLKTRFQH